MYGCGWFHENCEEVYGSKDVVANSLASFHVSCGFEYEFSASGA
jgi:hypothetical protein